MNLTTQPLTNVPAFPIDVTKIPPLLDAGGVKTHLAPIGRTLLYELATQGEIQTASLGIGRGKRVFVTASVVAWLARRVASTKQPKLALRAKGRGASRPVGQFAPSIDS